MKTLITLLTLFIAIPVMAAEGDPTPSPGLSLLLIIIPLVVPIVVAVGKFLLPAVPKWILPILAPALGALIDWLNSLVTGTPPNPVTGALLGSAGVGVRELLDQVKQRVTKGSRVCKG